MRLPYNQRVRNMVSTRGFVKRGGDGQGRECGKVIRGADGARHGG